MIRAFVFDLNGTILKTDQLKAESYAKAVAELCGDGVSEREVLDAYAEAVGQPRFEVAKFLVDRFKLEGPALARMEQFGVDAPWQVLVQIRKRYYDLMLDDPALIRQMRWPHNIALLRYAQDVGCQIALTSMTPRDRVMSILDTLDMSDVFDFIATEDDVAHGKPDPEIYLLVANALGFAPAEHLVIEDSVSGVQSAALAGMHVIAMTTPYSRAAVHEAGILPPELIVDDPRELIHAVTMVYDSEREQASAPTKMMETTTTLSDLFPPVDARLMPWIDVEQLKLANQVASSEFGISVIQMTELAGAAVADAVAELSPPGEIVVLAGGGNNGATGLSAARHISARGRFVQVVLATDELSEAGEHHLATLRSMGIEPIAEPSATARVVVDALVGYGLHGALSGRAAKLAEWAQSRWTLSADFPSGFGQQGSVRPDITVTFGLPKRGLESVERLLVADIGIPEQAWKSIGVSAGRPFSRGRVLEVIGLAELKAELEAAAEREAAHSSV